MASVTSPTPAARYHDRGSRVLSVTRADHIMIRYSDPDGKESMALAMIFGEVDYGTQGKPEDRLPGIWIVAGADELRDKLRRSSKAQAQEILAMLEERGLYHNGKPVAPGAPAPLPDVSAVFSEVEKEIEE